MSADIRSADFDHEVDLPYDRYDRLATEPEFRQGRPLRFATVAVLATLLGVGSAFAWHAAPLQSTIRTWSTAAIGSFFIRPTAAAASAPSATAPAASELAKRIEGLSGEIAVLHQQIDQLNAAQIQSAKAAAASQERLAALQQLMEQRTEAAIPQPPQPSAAARERRVAAAQPRPKPRREFKPKSEAVASPLRLGPSSTAE